MELKNLLATLASLTLLAAAPNPALAQHEHQQHEMHGSGGAVAVTFACAADSASQMRPTRTTVTSLRRRSSASAGTDVSPTTPPVSLNTGPPAPPKGSRMSVSIARG